MMTRVHRYAAILGFVLLGSLLGSGSIRAEEFTLPDLASGQVVLPWEELKSLLEELERSRTQQRTPSPESVPPVEYSLTDARYAGRVEEQFARFTADFTIQVLRDGWVTIPFLADEVGLESVRFEQDHAHAVKDANASYLVCKGPGQFSLQAVFRVPIQRDGRVHSLLFHTPPAVINQVLLQIPGQGVTLLDPDARAHILSTDDMTTLQTTLGLNTAVQAQWEMTKEAGISRKSTAEIHTLASVDKAAMTLFSTVTLKHVQHLENITLELPAEVEILDVRAPDVDRWVADTTPAGQRIRLVSQQERLPELVITLTYRATLPDLPAQVTIPHLTVRGVDSMDGVLGVEVLGNLDVTAEEVANAVLIPAKNLPQPLWQAAAKPLLYGYEFHLPDVQAALNIKRYEEIQTVVASVDMVECVTHRTLEGKSITRVHYFIRNNDRQFLTLTLPPHSRIWQAFLDAQAVKPAQKESGEILIPMKKSAAQGDDLQSFTIEIAYISDVEKLSLKGELLNELPWIDIPINYLRWTLYLPEDYEYTSFEGLPKQVQQFSTPPQTLPDIHAQIEIPAQGKRLLFEKYLIVDETPYVRGNYGQNLGEDIFLSVQPQDMSVLQKVTPRMDSSYP